MESSLGFTDQLLLTAHALIIACNPEAEADLQPLLFDQLFQSGSSRPVPPDKQLKILRYSAFLCGGTISQSACQLSPAPHRTVLALFTHPAPHMDIHRAGKD